MASRQADGWLQNRLRLSRADLERLEAKLKAERNATQRRTVRRMIELLGGGRP